MLKRGACVCGLVAPGGTPLGSGQRWELSRQAECECFSTLAGFSWKWGRGEDGAAGLLRPGDVWGLIRLIGADV